jgi:hypothetical protein
MNYITRVKNKNRKPISIRDFCEEIQAKWLANREIIHALNSNVYKLTPFINSLPVETLRAANIFKESNFFCYRFLNFLRTIYYLGSILRIDKLEEIKGVKLVSSSNFVTYIKSFAIQYKDRLKEGKLITREAFIEKRGKYVSVSDIQAPL